MNRFFLGGLFALLALVSTTPGMARAATGPDYLWQEVREAAIARSGAARQIVPVRYRSYSLNRGRLQAILRQAPLEKSQRPQDSGVTLQLPLADGRFGTFRIVESPVMEPALAAKYPQIKTYLGQGIDDPSATVRFDLTPKGFHAQVIGAGGTLYIDPFQPGDVDHYIAYRKHDHTRGERGICLVTGQPIANEKGLDGTLNPSLSIVSSLSSGATLRTYRLAMAATGEYTAFHGGTVADGLAAIVTTVNRVDGVYEREVSVRMVLVANNDLIIYTNAATDPYANTSNDLNANQSNVDSVIGSANYDVGHLVGTGGGGVAGLGVICSAANKARGLTGSSSPVADAFDIDYVAHEMGHQFSGNHTFNGSGGSCAGGNRNASTAYETGSGLTIQAYAGICGGDNVQPNSEDYFHRVSLNEILAHTTSGGGSTCGATSASGNAVPTVSTGATFTIPGRTPFTLTASGSDANGDQLTYLWEQFDLGAANAEGVLDATSTTGPQFRSFAPSTDPARTFPSLRYILNSANVVPATSALPGTTTPLWMSGEVLPNASRTLNFRVTVRDNRAGGGGTNEASTAITVNNANGPFAVTSPNTAVSLAAGSAQTVTWNVAGTFDAPVSTANVRITLSTDGGFTWPIELLASTPNDGTQDVTLPASIASTQARVRVEAVGNIYFDVSDANFTITTGGNTAPSISVTGSVTTRQGSPTASAVVATISDTQDAASALAVAVTGAPPELQVSVQNNNGSVTLFATADCMLVAPTTGNKAYPVLLRVTDTSGTVRTAEVVVNVGGNRTPTLGTFTDLLMTQNLVRQAVPNALAADANGNFSGASVSPATLPGGGTVSIAPDGTVTVTTTGSTTLGTYPIRPQIGDTCGAVETRQFNLVVGAPQVTLAVASSQVTSGNALIEPNECNQLNVTVRNDGNVTATGVNAVLSTLSSNVSITKSISSYADIPPGESRTNTIPFEVSTSNALTCFSNVNMTLTASYNQAGSPFAGALVLPVGRALATNYTFTASGGATLPSDGVLLPGSQLDDGLTDIVVPAGFNFSIYGTAITGGSTLRASSNGNLQVLSNFGAPDAANTTIPATGTGNGQNKFPSAAPTLFLQWDDWRMDGAAGGAALDAGIYTKLEGSAPNRRWIIEWRGRVRGDGAVTTNNNRAAIVLHEGSNAFDYIYLLTGVGAAENATGATIGVQSASSGTTFTQYALDNANLAPGTKLTASILPAICAPGTGGCVVAPTAPGAPTIGLATAGNASATVAFTPSANNGGSAITGYTATSSPGGFTSSGCVASPCTVNGLTNGVSYTFTVTATNVIGISPPS
ncbi:MAG: M12 family metallo-peptidase, partial [Gammaproteobacteria bacterium]|nr:M12 family metallo-peptidase [Gammaproteobacteria bacterium]